MTPIEIPTYHTKVDTLVKFGNTFQTKAIASLLQSPSMLSQYQDIINPNYFESDGNRWIVDKTLTYFSEYRVLPTLEFFKVELTKEEDATLKTEVVDKLKGVYQRLKDTDLDYVMNNLLDFAKNQTLKSAIWESVDYLEDGRFDAIKQTIDAALRAGQPKNVGHDWKEDFKSRLSKLSRDGVMTGWEPIDFIMNGGLAGGELGVVVAPSGAGKSWMLTAIGANAMRNGKKVIHYTLELNAEYVGNRYDTIFTGIEPALIPENEEAVARAIEDIAGDAKIKFYPAKSATCTTLSAHLQQVISLGYKPDLIILDYADLLRSTERTEARYLELGAIYEQLRGLAGEYNLPIWTASQSQRSSIQDDVIQADKIAESYSKIMTADFVMSLSRKLEDKITHTGRVHIIKNRFGEDGQTFPAYMNPGLGKLQVYDDNSPEGVMLKKKMQSHEVEQKKMLLDRFNEMSDDILTG